VIVILCVGVGVVRFALPYVFAQRVGALPPSTFGLARVCEKAGTAFTSAPAFSGPAPHPMEVVTAVQEQHVDLTDAGGLAAATGGDKWDPLTPEQVQLVACATRTSTGDVVRQCTYTLPGLPAGSGTDVPLRSATYQITVYEVRTHDQVGKADDVAAADTSCPPTAVTTSTGKDDIYAVLSPAQLRQLFAHLLG
jgi:hypothetical protein